MVCFFCCCCSTLSSYFKKKKTKEETPTLEWEVIQTAVPYTDITKQCFLCFHEKFVKLLYLVQSEILNKRLKLVPKCRQKINLYCKHLILMIELKSSIVNAFI